MSFSLESRRVVDCSRSARVLSLGYFPYPLAGMSAAAVCFQNEYDDQKAQEQWIDEDRNLTEPRSRNDDPIVQMKPQRLRLRLRTGVR